MKSVVLTTSSTNTSRLTQAKRHTLSTASGSQSLNIRRRRIQNDAERRTLVVVGAPAGALVRDKFTQTTGTLEHTLAIRATYDRERYNDLRCADYARPKTRDASLTHVITTNAALQVPSMPTALSLLADTEIHKKEDRVAQSVIGKQDFAYEVRATMRPHEDPNLTHIKGK